MKLLFDENLSRKLVRRLSELYPSCAHVSDFDLTERPDGDIWKFAQRKGFTIVGCDTDFYEFATRIGPPPQVVWLRRWRHPTKDAELVLRREAVRIRSFAADPNLGILVLDR